MDSVTQFVLGASVGAAVLGRRIGLRRAALTGGILGTLPDLDVFLPNDDPVDRFVTHRGATHSLIVHALVTPLLGELTRRVHALSPTDRVQVWFTVFLCLTTHALLDSLTIYGTQLFWPIWPEPLGLGSIFIVDPLYTLPLLIVTVWSLSRKNWSHRFGRALASALILSTVYLAWTVAIQRFVEQRGASALVAAGQGFERMTATPTPLNTLFWRVIAFDGRHYFNVYVPLLGGGSSVTLYRQQRWPDNLGCWVKRAQNTPGTPRRLMNFSDGFYRVSYKNEGILISDLRMGLTHSYVFNFKVAKLVNGVMQNIKPVHIRMVRTQPGDWNWLVDSVLGRKTVRPVEKDQVLPISNTGLVPINGRGLREC